MARLLKIFSEASGLFSWVGIASSAAFGGFLAITGKINQYNRTYTPGV